MSLRLQLNRSLNYTYNNSNLLINVGALMNTMVDINGSMEVLRYPTALLNAFFPGFSIIASAIYEYLKIDAAIYIPAMLLVSLLVFSSQYSGEYLWCQVEAYFMSTADIRVDDELYNMLMAVSDLGVLFPPWLYRIIEAVQAGTFRKFLLSPGMAISLPAIFYCLLNLLIKKF